MTNEEFERHVEFTLQQQAKFDAEMIELKAAQANTEKAVSRAADIISSLSTVMFEGFKISDAKIQALAESQKLTDEALRKLIARFDRHIGEDHPGLEN